MKIKTIIVLFLLIISQTYAQSVIDNPQFSNSIGQGKVTKVEILENSTVFHFDITLYTNKACHIPSSSYIQPVNSDKKYFVIDSEGVVLDEEFEVHGKLRKKYKLIFPKLPENVTHVKFDEFEHGNWEIHNLEVRVFKGLPKELVGNWFQTDGNNLWHHSFYNNKAIIEKEVYQYKSIVKRGNIYKITLENKNQKRKFYAKIKDENTVSFGDCKKDLISYTTKKIFNKKNQFNDNAIYTGANIFKADSATYSGIIANYTKASKYKTGVIHVNNIFTGVQETYLVKIKEDGSFSVRFPLNYPQAIFVRFPNYFPSVFVEPGKETWHLINSNSYSGSFFSGETALINTELNHFQYSKRNRNSYKELTKNIYNTSPEDYKKRCDSIHKKAIKTLNKNIKNKIISKKSLQIMRLNLEYQNLENLLNYDIYTRSRNEEKKAKYVTDSSYIDFLTPELIDNKLAVLTGSFSSVINRLSYSKHIRKRISVQNPQYIELAKILKEKGITLTDEENELLDSLTNFNKKTAKTIKKQETFNDSYKKTIESFYNKCNSIIQKIDKDKIKNLFNKEGAILDSILSYAEVLKIKFSKEEISTIQAQKSILTETEKQINKNFYTDSLIDQTQKFLKKYNNEIQLYTNNKLREKTLNNYLDYFGDKSILVSDIIICQNITGPIKKQVTPLSSSEIEKYSTYIKDSFIKQQLYTVNKNTLAKIETNKSKTGYVVNKTSNTEADKVFDAIKEKYKGKVIFVDFWATWCGPCRSAMTKMKPLKENFKNKDIVFVYITNQTSPKNTYNNMIPDINGEHYRVSSDEWNYLKDKFNITGIPHYTIVDKKGIVVKSKVNNRSNETLQNIFKEYL